MPDFPSRFILYKALSAFSYNFSKVQWFSSEKQAPKEMETAEPFCSLISSLSNRVISTKSLLTFDI